MTKDISPPLLGAKFESKLVTVSSSLLRQWCSARHKGGDSTSVQVQEAARSARESAESSLSEDGEGSKVDSEPEGCGTVSSLSAKKLLKLQKEAVCREFVVNMKPHYKTKFKTKVCMYICMYVCMYVYVCVCVCATSQLNTFGAV